MHIYAFISLTNSGKQCYWILISEAPGKLHVKL